MSSTETCECLACGYRFDGRTSELVLGQRRCPKPECRSLHVVSSTEIENIARLAEEYIEKYPLGAIPIFDVTEAVLRVQGIKLKPLETARLIRRVWERVTQKKPQYIGRLAVE